MDPILVVFLLFMMSLVAAVLLFFLFKNTAIIKIKNAEFGGAIAGFIVVFFLLDSAYQDYSESTQIDLQVPPTFEKFISQDYEFGLGYPNNFKYYEPEEMKRIGELVPVDETRAKIDIMIAGFKYFDYDTMSIADAREHLIKS